MDSEELKKWFVKMGYKGKLPKDLSHIYNASTAPLWNQVMRKVKPREEITRIRNNIIMNHFNETSAACEKDLNDASEMKEIQVWTKRKKLEEKLAFLKKQILSTEDKIDALANENKMNYLAGELLENKISEHRRYTFLLEKKAKVLEEELANVQGMVTTAANIFPSGSDENDAGVLDNLKLCSEKLEMIIQDNREKTKSESQMDDSLGLLSDSCLNFDNRSTSSPVLDKKNAKNLLYDKLVNADEAVVENLLRSHSRKAIWDNLNKLNKMKNDTLLDIVAQTDESVIEYKDEEAPLTMLYAKHAEYEIKKMEAKLKLKNLEEEVASVQNQIFNDVAEKYQSSSVDMIRAIQQKQENVRLLARIKHLQEAIDAMKTEAEDKQDLFKMEKEIQVLDKQIVVTLEELKEKYGVIELLQNDMKQMCADSFMKIAKLKLFFEDMHWMDPLTQPVALEEINVFLKYPLQKHFRTLQNYVYENFDSNALSVLAMLLRSPWSPPEVLMINLYKEKQKLAILKSLKTDTVVKKHSFEELEHQDSYLNYALDKMKSMMHSGRSIEENLKAVHTTVNLWMEMPIKSFVSPKQTVASLPYQEYEKLFSDYVFSLNK